MANEEPWGGTLLAARRDGIVFARYLNPGDYQMGSPDSHNFAIVGKQIWGTLTAPLAPGRFNHVVATYDYASAASQGTMRLYVNGVLAASRRSGILPACRGSRRTRTSRSGRTRRAGCATTAGSTRSRRNRGRCRRRRSPSTTGSARPAADAGDGPAETGPPARPLRSGLMHDAITDVPGIEVGHFSDAAPPDRLYRDPPRATARSAAWRCAARRPARARPTLPPGHAGERAHAVVLCGGSAFGLAAASGVARHLADAGIGFDAGGIRVPIVPAAVIFDLAIGEAAWPDVEAGRRAAAAASGHPPEQGCAGAGTGATVGKLLGMERATKSGVGTASARRAPRAVGAIVVVNAGGDVVDPAAAASSPARAARTATATPTPSRSSGADSSRRRRCSRRRSPSSRPTRRSPSSRPTTSPPSPTTASRARSAPSTRSTTATRSSRSRPARRRRRSARFGHGHAPGGPRGRCGRARDARRGAPGGHADGRPARRGRMSDATIRAATRGRRCGAARPSTPPTWSKPFTSPAPPPPPEVPVLRSNGIAAGGRPRRGRRRRGRRLRPDRRADVRRVEPPRRRDHRPRRRPRPPRGGHRARARRCRRATRPPPAAPAGSRSASSAPTPPPGRSTSAPGSSVEGVLREEFHLDGRFVDDVLMARDLTPSEGAR